MSGKNLAPALLAIMLLAGCDTTIQESLGLGKRAPDEFQVVRRAPLVIPPSATLPPPRPGAAGPGRSTAAEAEELLTGRPADTAPRGSPAELALLQASPVQAEPDVRSRIVEEDGELLSTARRTFLFILDFQRAQFEPEDEVLDAGAEAAQLRAAERGSPVVTTRVGSTPLPSS